MRSETYRGKIVSVTDGVFVEIPARAQGFFYGPVEVATHDRLAVNDRVVCVFIGSSDYDVIIMGRIQPVVVSGFPTHPEHTGTDAHPSHVTPGHSH